MTHLHYYMLGVTLLLSSFTYFAKAARVNTPAIGNVTYWMPGSTVALNWTYNLEAGDNLNSRSWTFKSKPQDKVSILVFRYLDNPPQYKSSRNITYIELSTLFFQNASIADNGTYTFELGYFDGLTKKIQSEVEVIILVQPTANVNCSSNNRIKEGENFSCFCNGFTGNPPPLANWSNSGVVINGNGFETKELVFENVTKDMTGNYTCAVRSHNLTDSKVIELLVQSQPTAKTNCTANITTDEGQGIFYHCKCEAEGGNPAPDASWFRGENVSLNSKMLLLGNVTRQDRGKYCCKVNSLDLTDEKCFQVFVKYAPINVNIGTNISSTYNDVNTTFPIICTADAFPQANYTISHNGITLPSVNGVYIIKSMKSSDGGRYECVAKNSVGNSSNSFQLNVKAQPTAKTNCSANITVSEGEGIFCRCWAEGGNPPPNASWFNSADESLKSKMLSLGLVTRQDRGKYCCKVNSLDLEDEKCVQVFVKFKPVITYFSSDAFDNRTKAGSTVNISGSADGYPDVNVTIYRGHKKLATARGGLVVYTIKPVKKCDAEEYTCVAKNRLGTTTRTFKLTVVYPCNCVIVAIVIACLVFLILVVVITHKWLIPPIKQPKSPDFQNTIELIVAIVIACLVFLILLLIIVCWLIPLIEYRNKGDCQMNTEFIVTIVIACLVFFILLLIIIRWLIPLIKQRKSREKERRRQREEESMNSPGGNTVDGNAPRPENPYEVTDEGNENGGADSGNTVDGNAPRPENPYELTDERNENGGADSDRPSTSATDNSAAPAAEPGLPPVYAVVDKSKIPPKEKPVDPSQLTYASLDPVVLQPDSSKMRPRPKEETNYASIELGKL